MQFTTRAGKELYLAPQHSHSIKNTIVHIIGSNDEHFIIRDIDGIVIEFPKYLLDVNGIPVLDNTIVLSEALYARYVQQERENLNEKASDLIKDNFLQIIDHKELILQTPEYFLIRSSLLTSGAVYIGSLGYCLGSWLESMEELEVHSEYMISVGGSPLSGMNSYTAYDIKSRKIKRYLPYRTGHDLPGGFMIWLKKLEALSKRYSYYLRSNYLAVNKLIAEIQSL
jgi:hypothetical protein